MRENKSTRKFLNFRAVRADEECENLSTQKFLRNKASINFQIFYVDNAGNLKFGQGYLVEVTEVRNVQNLTFLDASQT